MSRALVFDSGVGGLSVVAEMRARMPELSIDYAADDAFRPYGEKTDAQLQGRLPGLLATLVEMTRPDIVVIACNTASTIALDPIRAALDVPVVGVVPAVKPAALATRTGAIGVLGTPSTVRQNYVEDLIADFAQDKVVRLRGSVALVELAEAKLAGHAPDADALRAEIALLFGGKPEIDTVVLACTHFPLLREELAAVAPEGVDWIDSGEAIARRVESLLSDTRGEARGDVAFLIGPDANAVRTQAFAQFGFPRVVGLES